MEIVTDFYFLSDSKIATDGDYSHAIKRCLLLGRKFMINLDNILKSRDINLSTKVHLVKIMVFPVIMCGCESWTIKKAERWKKWCFWTVLLEKILESPLDWKEIQAVHHKGNQSWVFIGRTDAEAETLKRDYLMWRLTHLKGHWCWERLKVGAEGDHRGWEGLLHHQLNGHEFEHALGVCDAQGGLVCCILWGHKELDMTERLNWTELEMLAKLKVKIFFSYVFI